MFQKCFSYRNEKIMFCNQRKIVISEHTSLLSFLSFSSFTKQFFVLCNYKKHLCKEKMVLMVYLLFSLFD